MEHQQHNNSNNQGQAYNPFQYFAQAPNSNPADWYQHVSRSNHPFNINQQFGPHHSFPSSFNQPSSPPKESRDEASATDKLMVKILQKSLESHTSLIEHQSELIMQQNETIKELKQALAIALQSNGGNHTTFPQPPPIKRKYNMSNRKNKKAQEEAIEDDEDTVTVAPPQQQQTDLYELPPPPPKLSSGTHGTHSTNGMTQGQSTMMNKFNEMEKNYKRLQQLGAEDADDIIEFTQTNPQPVPELINLCHVQSKKPKLSLIASSSHNSTK